MTKVNLSTNSFHTTHPLLPLSPQTNKMAMDPTMEKQMLENINNAPVAAANYFTDEQLARFAKDPKNRVFQFTHDRPTEKEPAAIIQQQATDIRQRYVQLKQQNPTWADDKIRSRLVLEMFKWKRFQERYNQVFMRLTSSTTTDEQVSWIMQMMQTLEEQESGLITQQQANAIVHQQMWKRCSKKIPKQSNS